MNIGELDSRNVLPERDKETILKLVSAPRAFNSTLDTPAILQKSLSKDLGRMQRKKSQKCTTDNISSVQG